MKSYRLKLLSPLFYRTNLDSGASGSTVTSPWIGDIALSYAINRTFGLKELKFGYTRYGPKYEELIKLPFISSVAVPLDDIERTRVYDIATSFCSDGYYNFRAFKSTFNTSMRNWLKRQGIESGNEFIFSLGFKEDWETPDSFTIRVGNSKECLAYCERIEPQGEVTANAYTLSKILGVNVEKMPECKKVERVLAQYILLHGMSASEWLSMTGCR